NQTPIVRHYMELKHNRNLQIRLALECVTVVLKDRYEKIGSNTVSLLVKYGLENVFLYQLDVQDQSSADSLAKYVKTQFGRLDILLMLTNPIKYLSMDWMKTKPNLIRYYWAFHT
ncbi:hypothetical protein MKX03_008798, partial [Papaver bracteatum]